MTYELILANFILFVLGFVLGRVTSERGKKVSEGIQKPKSFLNDNNANVPSGEVKIDEGKFVTKVKTDSFEKSYKELGDKKKTKQDISSSVSKLSQLKKK